MNAKEYYEYCVEQDTVKNPKYHGEHLPSSWVEEESAQSKEQKHFKAMYERAVAVIGEELPTLIEKGWVEASTTEDDILRRAWTQFARKSGIRADRPHLRPNLFNAFISDKAHKYPEPAIINAGVGKGGNGGVKIELSEEQETRIQELLVERANAGDFDLDAVQGAIVSIACEGLATADYTAEDADILAVEDALEGLEESDFLTAVKEAVAKAKTKCLKARAEPKKPSFEAVQKKWSAETQETYAGFLFYKKKNAGGM